MHQQRVWNAKYSHTLTIFDCIMAFNRMASSSRSVILLVIVLERKMAELHRRLSITKRTKTICSLYDNGIWVISRTRWNWFHIYPAASALFSRNPAVMSNWWLNRLAQVPAVLMRNVTTSYTRPLTAKLDLRNITWFLAIKSISASSQVYFYPSQSLEVFSAYLLYW